MLAEWSIRPNTCSDMANKRALLMVGVVLSLTGCAQQEVVKAGVPPPSSSGADVARRKTETTPNMRNTRGGLDLPKNLPKGPY